MPTSKQQSEVFLKLKNDLRADENWIEFWKYWDGFILTIIRKKLFFAPDTWEDCKLMVDAKILRSVNGFDETKEVSPWLYHVVRSCCEDIKLQDECYRELKRAKKRVKDRNSTDVVRNEEWSRLGAGDSGEESSGETPTKITVISIDDENFNGLLEKIKQPDPGAGPEREEMIQNLWICIEAAMLEMEIEPRKKVAFELHYRHERKLREIADIYHLPISTVNNWPGATWKKIMPIVRAGMEKLEYTSYCDDKKRRDLPYPSRKRSRNG